MRGSWDRRRVIAIAVGGAAGATLRWALVTSVESGRFPWPVFALNVVGSVLLGVLLAVEWSPARIALHDAGGIGFCGGLTTFSTFSLEVVDLARDGNTGLAITYTAVSVLAAVLGIAAGAGALRRLRAITIPLETEP